MTKLLPVLIISLVFASCTTQQLGTVMPTLDSMEGFKYKDPKPTSGTSEAMFLFPAIPLHRNFVGGLAKLDGSDQIFKDAYDKAREAVGADTLIHYSYEVKVDWYVVVGWAWVTCTGTGVKYAE